MLAQRAGHIWFCLDRAETGVAGSAIMDSEVSATDGDPQRRTTHFASWFLLSPSLSHGWTTRYKSEGFLLGPRMPSPWDLNERELARIKLPSALLQKLAGVERTSTSGDGEGLRASTG